MDIKTEDFYIKTQVLKQLLEPYDDFLSVGVKNILTVSNSINLYDVLQISNKLRSIIVESNYDVKTHYQDGIYWYILYLAYGEDTLESVEKMEYIDRYTITLIPGINRMLSLAGQLRLFVLLNFKQLPCSFNIILDEDGEFVSKVEIIYDRPEGLTNDDCVVLNKIIILAAFDKFDYESI